MPITTPELLDRLLSGEVPTPALIDELIMQQVREDHLLDYKVGDWLHCTDRQVKAGNPTKAADRLRAWVTGFANGDGGVLLIGVADDDAGGAGIKPWSVTGCDVPGKGKQSWEQWVADCLRGIAHLLVPAPRVEVVPHDHGDVLVIAVHRAPNLVPMKDAKGGVGHYLRFGDGTHWIPPYLHADLALGRRQRPAFELTDMSQVRPLDTQGSRAAIRPHFVVRNSGLAWARSPRIGIIGMSLGAGNEPPRDLRAYLDVAADPAGCSVRYEGPIGLPRPMNTPDKLEPFSCREWNVAKEYEIPVSGQNALWCAAVFVFSEDSPPTWFQIEVVVEKLPKLANPYVTHNVTITPIHIGRVRVGIE